MWCPKNGTEIENYVPAEIFLSSQTRSWSGFQEVMKHNSYYLHKSERALRALDLRQQIPPGTRVPGSHILSAWTERRSSR